MNDFNPAAFKRIDFQAEVKKYGEQLDEIEKNIARKLFKSLLEHGRSYEWIYYATINLYGRPLINNTRLFFFKPFIDEVNELCSYYDEQYRQYEESI